MESTQVKTPAGIRPSSEVPVDKPAATARWPHRLFAPVDIGLIVFFRVAFGTIMLWEACRYLLPDVLGRTWIERFYIAPEFHFTYLGFSWVQPWPGNGMYWHFGLMGLFAACVIAGLFYRVAAVGFFLSFLYVFLLEQTRYLNHFYLVSLVSFVMIWMPANRAFSLDVLMRPSLRTTTVPVWTLWLLRFHVGMPYFFGGIAKLNSDWLQGEPMRMFLVSRFGDVPESVVYFFTYGGLLFDLLIVPFLLWRRTFVPAFLAALVFNFTNDSIFQIGIFPWFMVCGTLLFCPPDWLKLSKDDDAADEGAQSKRPSRRERRRQERLAARTEDIPRSLNWRQKVVIGFWGTYLVVQCLLPFRHFLYPGNVSWTEEGHNFAWHMKLRSKSALAEFAVTTQGGEQFGWRMVVRNEGMPEQRIDLVFSAADQDGNLMEVDDPAPGLSQRQLRGMASKPDLILQFVHHLAGRLRELGYTPVEARASAAASLNGREPQQLIDPTVNLLDEKRSIWSKSWIVPLTTELTVGQQLPSR